MTNEYDSVDWGTVVTQGRVRPARTGDTDYFWDGLVEHRLLIQRCLQCKTLRHPPGPMCPRCHSLEWDAVDSPGRGAVFSYTVVHAPYAPGFWQPSIIGVVELDEGVRVVANVIGTSPDELSLGTRVEVFFADQAEGWTVPQFRVVA
jgi:uncharacterized OB-fold protein